MTAPINEAQLTGSVPARRMFEGDQSDLEMLTIIAQRMGLVVSDVVTIEPVLDPIVTQNGNGHQTANAGGSRLMIAGAEHSDDSSNGEHGQPPDPELLVTATKEDFISWYEAHIDPTVTDLRSFRARKGGGTKTWNFLARAIRDGFSVPKLSSPPLPEFRRAVFKQTAPLEPPAGARGSGEPGAQELDISRSNNLDLVGLGRYLLTVSKKLQDINRAGQSLNGPAARAHMKEFMPYGVSMRGLAVLGFYGRDRYESVRHHLQPSEQAKLDVLFLQELPAAAEALMRLHMRMGHNQARQAKALVGLVG